ncbi:trans-1,2-dihydrobenzene-1,2-diol dehydrogenase-like [Ruditapes philippinarum]|uniref:trans-1,2-dihydrobenzene-1,2-diol dehydrogenase-like n=1 Tax=Ruditapes philippinarum TaxID=129788 RepID=UPI00295AF4B4|nr:trans-1,2-dihydrobenzene-1,2-diol dehydrogenase-like [Ruditapes philippinarum]XP_060606684.1 trans-1,2-dihydrobenzene-1,2-diol dehydrogenase-like [Ruditapes philippinarum]
MATRWACLGPGKISSDFFNAIQENLPSSEHEFIAVASRDQSKSQQFADKYKFKRAYSSYDDVAKDKDVEIVYIGTIHITHAELSMKMLEAGKHVLCEKPMAMNYKQAKKVIDFAKSRKLLFVEGIWSRFFPVYDEIRQAVSAGTLGDIRLVQANMCVPLSHVERIYELKLGGGGLLDIGVYVIQFACMVFNEMPESITTVGNLMEGGADENACIILKYKNGAIANLVYHTSVENSNSNVICGTKGVIEVEQPLWSPTRIRMPSGVKEFPLKDGEYNFKNSAGFQYEAAAVRDCLLKGLTEHPFVTHGDSEMISQISDKIRGQLGVVYPDFD